MRVILHGFFATLGLLTLYALTMTFLTRSWEATFAQFQALWWLMVPLASSFGVQVGLYTKLTARGGIPFRRDGHGLGKKDTMVRGRSGPWPSRELRYTDPSAAGPTNSKASVAVGGTSASVGMLACCAHHVTDVLPLIGLSGLSFFLASYQIPILIISLIINLVGILVMLKHLHKLAI